MSDLTVADELALDAMPAETRALIERLVAARVEAQADRDFLENYDIGFADGRGFERRIQKMRGRLLKTEPPIDNSTLEVPEVDESPKRPSENFVVHPPTKRLVKNAARCKSCGTVVESTHVHDFKWCACKKMFVDGGLQYIRRGGALDVIEELSVWVDD